MPSPKVTATPPMISVVHCTQENNHQIAPLPDHCSHYLAVPWAPQIQQNPNWTHNLTLSTLRLVFPLERYHNPQQSVSPKPGNIFLFPFLPPFSFFLFFFLFCSFSLVICIPPYPSYQHNYMLVSNAFYMCHTFSGNFHHHCPRLCPYCSCSPLPESPVWWPFWFFLSPSFHKTNFFFNF